MAEVSENQNTEGAGNKKSKAPIIIIIAVVLATALAIVGFFLKDSIMPLKGINGQPLSSNCRFNDKDLCRFMNNFKGLENMSVSSSTMVNGKKTESTMEIQGTDKSHITTTVDGKEESNYISISNTTYMKDYSDNKWWKTTTDVKNNEGGNIDWKAEFEKSVNDSQDKTTYKKISKEACGKLTCLKYQVIDPNNTEVTQYMWFDTKEYLLRKTRDEAKGVVTEATFSYDKENIQEPSPVKELKEEDAYKAFLDDAASGASGSQGLTPEQLQQLQNLGQTGGDVPTEAPAP